MINGKVSKLIINSGSCTNATSTEAVHKLRIKTMIHPSPYKLAWLNNVTELGVSHQAMIVFFLWEVTRIRCIVMWCLWMLVIFC